MQSSFWILKTIIDEQTAYERSQDVGTRTSNPASLGRKNCAVRPSGLVKACRAIHACQSTGSRCLSWSIPAISRLQSPGRKLHTWPCIEINPPEAEEGCWAFAAILMCIFFNVANLYLDIAFYYYYYYTRHRPRDGGENFTIFFFMSLWGLKGIKVVTKMTNFFSRSRSIES